MKPFSLQTPATRGLKKEDFSFYPDILLSRLLSKWTIDDSSTRGVHFLSEMKLSLLSRLSYGAKIIFQISIFVFFFSENLIPKTGQMHMHEIRITIKPY